MHILPTVLAAVALLTAASVDVSASSDANPPPPPPSRFDGIIASSTIESQNGRPCSLQISDAPGNEAGLYEADDGTEVVRVKYEPGTCATLSGLLNVHRGIAVFLNIYLDATCSKIVYYTSYDSHYSYECRTPGSP